MPPRIPTEADAALIVETHFGAKPRSLQRFTTGNQHFVFDAVTATGLPVVVRMTDPRDAEDFEGGVYWLKLLRSLEIPVPEVLEAEISGALMPFPYMVLSRLPGKDLWHVYQDLSREQKTEIAYAVIRIQDRVKHSLKPGDGFGFAVREGATPFLRWLDVVFDDMRKNKDKLAGSDVFDVALADPLVEMVMTYSDYLMNVPATPFLHDTTTKNVIIDRGRLSGIVDVDTICYGDPLWVVALTRSSLLCSGFSTDYADYWFNALQVGQAGKEAMTLYTAVHVFNFIGELAEILAANKISSTDHPYAKRVLSVYKSLLEELADFQKKAAAEKK
jgi:aminoglycoside phosphotransferase (APT) family kinase protein